MNLTNGETFTMSMIKHAKNRVNQKIKFPRDTKRLIQEIEVNNGWNTHNFQMLREIHDGNILFKENLLSRIPKPFELTHESIKTSFKYKQPYFKSILFDES